MGLLCLSFSWKVLSVNSMKSSEEMR